ncbi:undecaprenol kinase domain protein [Leptospira interrogans serovar Pyrogenes str. 200701872]|nr:undecaprenol kinase domain protein [Leptospira interrogans serovar Pyrogenes str. 200701872]
MALIPGMSRSAATIITARFLGKDTKSSAEFSFFLPFRFFLQQEFIN